MKKRFTLSIVLLCISMLAVAQDGYVATLIRQLNEPLHDTVKVNLYYRISRYYWNKNTDSVLLMARHGIELADSIQFKKGKALNCLSMGVALAAKGNYPEALTYELESLRISEALKMDGLTGNVYSNIAGIYLNNGNISKAIEYYNKALSISKRYGEVATCPILINLGDLHTQTKEYGIAMEYAVRALQISRSQTDSSNIAILLFNISEIYKKTNRTDSARLYLQQSAVISARIYDYAGVSFCLNSIAEMMASEGNYREGIAQARKSLMNLERVKDQELLMEAYHILYRCYSGLGEFEKALSFRNQEITLRDNIYNIEKEREANNLVNQYNLDRKELQIQLLEQNKALQQKEIARVSLINTVYGVGAFLFALLAGYFIVSTIRWKNYNRLIKERNSVIQEQKATIIRQKIHLERLNSVKDKIISIISHDFRSPLHTLHGFLQLFKKNSLSKQEITHATDRIDKSLQLTLDMIENLLTWGNTQMSGQLLTPIPFDIGKLVQETVQLVHLQAENKKITIVNNVTSPTLVFADKDTLNIVLRNLISNAIKFSKRNDCISILAQEDECQTTVSIKDTGVGISPKQQKSLFNETLNISTAGTANEKGTGLGLSLCQELVQQNRGKIWVESTLGQGSTFFFTLPHHDAKV
ncbi:MAG: tetratricopeptide repeat protein [Chryseolinea sp.]